jgi:hypothetical protein
MRMKIEKNDSDKGKIAEFLSPEGLSNRFAALNIMLRQPNAPYVKLATE